MKVNGRDLDVREESIWIEQDGTTSMVCHVEACREELVIHVFNCFLQGDNVPISPQSVFRLLLLFHAEVLGSNCKH